MTVTRLLTRKDHVGETRVDTIEPPALADGEVALAPDRFSVTTNNITYAAFGDAMNYWDFFPTGEEGWGHMPVWGFANVTASTVPGVEVGERFYGYFPVASEVRMKAERVTERGFYDAAPHRLVLTSAYNQYTRCSTDPAYEAELENELALFRPLYLTSFMLADFLQDNGFFGATRIVVSSASSKTAYGTAFGLAGQGVELVGLTSDRNRGFVEGLGLYDRTVAYDELSGVAADQPTLYLDFSGDGDLRMAVHRHFGEALVYDCYAGSAQSTDFIKPQDLPGPAPAFYFAPVQIKKRNADWGPAEVTRRFAESQRAFIARATDGVRPWIRIEEREGFEAAGQVVADLFAGRADPLAGFIVRLG